MAKHNPARHHRRSIRLPAYDYAQAGAYFLTICSQHRECVFGEVIQGQMILNAPGQMVESVWHELAQRYLGVLVGAGPCACPDSGRPQGVAPTISLPDVVHRFKSLTTARYRTGVLQHDWRPFPDRLWQRNYYEHVLRDEEELNRVRQYVIDNPARWQEDPENPAHQT